jgi:hypothetical protein
MPTMPPKSGHFNPGLPMPKVPTHTMRGNSGNDSGNEIDKNGNAARLLINRRRRPTRAQTPEKISARAIRFIPATSPATIPARFRQDSGKIPATKSAISATSHIHLTSPTAAISVTVSTPSKIKTPAKTAAKSAVNPATLFATEYCPISTDEFGANWLPGTGLWPGFPVAQKRSQMGQRKANEHPRVR